MTKRNTYAFGILHLSEPEARRFKHIVDWDARWHTVILYMGKRMFVLSIPFDNPIARLFFEAWQDGNIAIMEHYWETQGSDGPCASYETQEEYERARSREWWRAWRRSIRTQIGFWMGRPLCAAFGHPASRMQIDDEGSVESGPCVYWSCDRCGQGGGGWS